MPIYPESYIFPTVTLAFARTSLSTTTSVHDGKGVVRVVNPTDDPVLLDGGGCPLDQLLAVMGRPKWWICSGVFNEVTSQFTHYHKYLWIMHVYPQTPPPMTTLSGLLLCLSLPATPTGPQHPPVHPVTPLTSLHAPNVDSDLAAGPPPFLPPDENTDIG